MGQETELDKIIRAAKIDPATAMVVFAMELKSQGEKIDSLVLSITDDNNRYSTKEQFASLSQRVKRIENALLWVLGFVFMTVLGALLALVLGKGIGFKSG